MRTALTSLVAAVALAAPAAAPAATFSSGDVQVVETAKAQNIGDPTSASRTTMSFECAAVAAGAISVRVSECYLLGLHSGTRYDASVSTPGTTTAAASAGARSVGFEPYAVCMRTSAAGVDGSYVETTLRCTTN